jgi:hypothetical protein
MRIREAQKYMDPTDPDPQHCLKQDVPVQLVPDVAAPLEVLDNVSDVLLVSAPLTLLSTPLLSQPHAYESTVGIIKEISGSDPDPNNLHIWVHADPNPHPGFAEKRRIFVCLSILYFSYPETRKVLKHT